MGKVSVTCFVLGFVVVSAVAKPAPDGRPVASPLSLESALQPPQGGEQLNSSSSELPEQIKSGVDVFMDILGFAGGLLKFAGDIATKKEFHERLDAAVDGANSVLSAAPKIVETKVKLVQALVSTILGIQEVLDKSDVGPKANNLLDLGIRHTQSTIRRGNDLLLKLLTPDPKASAAKAKLGLGESLEQELSDDEEREVAMMIANLLRTHVAVAENDAEDSTGGANASATSTSPVPTTVSARVQEVAQDDVQAASGVAQDDSADGARDDDGSEAAIDLSPK